MLSAGTKLGPFEIAGSLGAGGMGEVYRARDTKLNRDVALKIVPDLFANDPERLARFRREAQVLASLNHPNIGHIYGFEDAASPPALVLELVEGPTLADRIAYGPLPLAEVLPIAKQIAEALEAAHEHGVVHRDLKPANIKVRDDGTVKVLDFGLAKALDPTSTGSADALNSPTLTAPTQMGVVLGTAAYMSPEQAKGKTVDRRADIWAFGAVLYEMLSGKRAFLGDDISDTLAAVLRQELDWTALPADTPAPVGHLIARCLDRDVKRRLRDIGEARVLLEESPARLESPLMSELGARQAVPVVQPRPMWQRLMPFVLTAVVASAVAGTIGWLLRPLPPVAVTRFTVTLPEGETFSALLRRAVVMSPDGRKIVYTSKGRFYLRSLAELSAQPIQGTEDLLNVQDPAFSPDGETLVFFALGDRTLKRIALSGGAAVTICPIDSTSGIHWGADGIVFGNDASGIMRISPNAGKPEVIVSSKDGEIMHGPQLLRGGQVLFTVTTSTAPNRWDQAQIVVQSLSSGQRRTLIEGGSDARYLPTGHLVYANAGSLYRVPFDVERLQLTGTPAPVVHGVRRATPPATGAAHFGVSDTGSLAFIPGPASAVSGLFDIAVADRNGVVQSLKLPPGMYVAPRVSPDGKRIAVGVDDAKGAFVAVYDLAGSTAMRPLTFGGNNRFPIWSSDGRRVTFQSDRERDLAIFWQPADGTGVAERLTKPAPGESHVPESWSPDGDVLLFNNSKGGSVSLWRFSLRDRKAAPFGEISGPYPTGAVFSPDGRWVAYLTSERGRATVFVQPFPATGAKYQLFTRGSDLPHEMVWSPDGKELFYNPRPGEFEAVTVTTQPTFGFGNPVTLARPFQLGPPSARRAYDITPDGKFVVLIAPGSGHTTPWQIHVVLNWFEELKHTRN